MTEVERLAEFATRASYEMLSDAAREQLKIHLLDALGCAIGALLVRKKFDELTAANTTPNLRDQIADAVQHLERMDVSGLAALLATVGAERGTLAVGSAGVRQR